MATPCLAGWQHRTRGLLLCQIADGFSLTRQPSEHLPAPGRSSTGKADLRVHRRQFVSTRECAEQAEMQSGHLEALGAARWKGVWMRAPLTFPHNPQWPWECILKAANLAQILWFLSGRSRNPRRLSGLLTLHGHLTVQRRHTRASCHNSPPCAIVFYENTRVP